jgi:hypothetical protein
MVAQEVRGEQSYSSSLQSSVSADFGGWGAAFSASSEYRRVEEETRSDHNVYMQASATCSVYSVQVNAFKPPRVTANFLAGVQRLPETYSAENAAMFDLFIATFGTHVMFGAEFGGEWGQMSEFSQSAWSNMLSTGLDVSASASYSGIISAGGSLSTESERSDAQSFASAATEQRIFNKGGSYSQSSTEWIDSVMSQPMPIFYHLWPLDEVLQPSFMPSTVDEVALAAKRQSLRTALASYCSKLLVGGYVSTCGPPAPDPTPVPAVREWMPFADSHRPHGTYFVQECPPRAYITEMKWREEDGYGLVDLTATCSNTPASSLLWTKNDHGSWNSALTCTNGFSKIQAKEQWGYGIINVKAQCLDTTTEQESNHNGNGGWKGVQTCPDSTQVLVGFEVLQQDGYGIVNYRPKCSNGNLPSRRLQADFLV